MWRSCYGRLYGQVRTEFSEPLCLVGTVGYASGFTVGYAFST